MDRIKRLRRIAKLGANAERAAAQILAQTLQLSSRQQVQLEELKRYRAEYAANLCSATAKPMTHAEANQLQQFVRQLDSVIVGLEKKLEHVEHQRLQHQAAWAAQSRKTKALNEVVSKNEQMEAARQEARADLENGDRRTANPEHVSES